METSWKLFSIFNDFFFFKQSQEKPIVMRFIIFVSVAKATHANASAHGG